MTIQDTELALWAMWSLPATWFVWLLLRFAYSLFRRWRLRRFATRLSKVYRTP